MAFLNSWSRGENELSNFIKAELTPIQFFLLKNYYHPTKWWMEATCHFLVISRNTYLIWAAIMAKANGTVIKVQPSIQLILQWSLHSVKTKIFFFSDDDIIFFRLPDTFFFNTVAPGYQNQSLYRQVGFKLRDNLFLFLLLKSLYNYIIEMQDRATGLMSEFSFATQNFSNFRK